MQMVHTVISRDTRISNHDQLLAVSGSEADVQAVRRVLEEVQRDAETNAAASTARPLRVSFSFLLGTVGGAATPSGSELPESLRPVAAALRESGFGDTQLLAPVEVFLGDRGREFQLTGNAQRDEATIELQLRGQTEPTHADGARPNVVRLTVDAKLVASRMSPAGQPNAAPAPPQMMRNNLFQLQTTIDAPLGEHVVLAASPGSMGGNEAIALVVRVTEAK
jgi:hypothetical protein